MMYRSLFVVAATGVASVAAFAVPPSAMPARASSLRLGGATAPRSARSASLGLEMARVPFIAGNWKMNPTSVAEVISGSLLAIPAGPGARCLLACDVQNASQGALITHFPLPPPLFRAPTRGAFPARRLHTSTCCLSTPTNFSPS